MGLSPKSVGFNTNAKICVAPSPGNDANAGRFPRPLTTASIAIDTGPDESVTVWVREPTPSTCAFDGIAPFTGALSYVVTANVIEPSEVVIAALHTRPDDCVAQALDVADMSTVAVLGAPPPPLATITAACVEGETNARLRRDAEPDAAVGTTKRSA